MGEVELVVVVCGTGKALSATSSRGGELESGISSGQALKCLKGTLMEASLGRSIRLTSAPPRSQDLVWAIKWSAKLICFPSLGRGFVCKHSIPYNKVWHVHSLILFNMIKDAINYFILTPAQHKFPGFLSLSGKIRSSR